MANDIAKSLFRVMAQDGIVFSIEAFKTLQATYYQEARFEIAKYGALCKLNALEYDREKEIAAVNLFEEAIREASCEFYIDPMGIPPLTPWVTIRSVLPDFSEKFVSYVTEDSK